jgi:hypothetical protein
MMKSTNEDAQALDETAVDEALRSGRAEAARLEAESRYLFAVSVIGLSFVSARGIYAIVASTDPQSSPGLAAALAIAAAVFVALHVHGMQRRRRFERMLGHVSFLELARAAADQSAGSSRVVLLHEPVAAPHVSALLDRSRSVVRRLTAGVAAVAAVGLLLSWVGSSAPSAPKLRRWLFVETDSAPTQLGLRSHAAESGQWVLEDDVHATGARAMVNREGEPGAQPGIVTAADLSARDVRATTRCKASASKATQACGLVFRFQDVANHHVARVDLVRGELTVAAVSGGTERILGSVPVGASANVWQEIAIETRGDRIHVTWNGSTAIDAVDTRHAIAGSVGIWAPAAAEASFDDLSVEALPTSVLGGRFSI